MSLIFAAIGGLASCETAPLREASPPGSSSQPYARVQSVLDRRCAVCHSCFTAPCQLNLASHEGVDRGASQEPVYEATRLNSAAPTRLFQDARTTREWRERGFFAATPLISRMLDHKAAHPEAFEAVDPEAKGSCPKDAESMEEHLEEHPAGGMPLGFPALASDERAILARWLAEGAPGPDAAARAKRSNPSNGEKGLAELRRWESFLNQPGNKPRIAARYIYEHLFMAHLHFDAIPGDFYRLVRSRTPAPEPVDEIATRRPFDDPGVERVHYRLVRVTDAIVRKSHAPYRLNDAKLRRWKELFIDARWSDPNPPLPSHEPAVAANPFAAFAAIPARSRYQFLLDDAYYHVRTFIHGPVCKGNVALNVIQSRFLIFMLKPEADRTVTDPAFLQEAAADLSMPVDGEDGIEALLTAYQERQKSYRGRRLELYRRSKDPGRDVSDLWDGDGAVMTVFRHFDSADVVRGALGGEMPKTAWVMDYPVFERIYYDLVAGFDVYGNVVHQTATRRYMDNLRTESEDLFLSFLPRSVRGELRDFWYRGESSKRVQDGKDPFYRLLPEPRLRLAGAGRRGADALKRDAIERMIRGRDARGGAKDLPIRALDALRGPAVQAMPEVSFVRLRGRNGDDRAATIVNNREHLNVSFMFEEKKYREPSADHLTVAKGLVGNFPNLFFDVPEGEEARFLAAVRAGKPDRYAVRRMSPDFWSKADWFQERVIRDHGSEAGLLDLSRYGNR